MPTRSIILLKMTLLYSLTHKIGILIIHNFIHSYNLYFAFSNSIKTYIHEDYNNKWS